MGSLFLVFFFLCLFRIGAAIILESVVIGAGVLGYAFRCKLYECCNEDYIPLRLDDLKLDLENKLYGQHIAKKIIFSSIKSHVRHDNPKKSLVLSFHGLPGSGKNYVASMIAKALFKKGEKSSYYHFYNGRNDFPLDALVNDYKKDLQSRIKVALSNCERSLFVFDEVDKMPPTILDVLVPFLDYTSYNSNGKSKAIFIFLSNTGSTQIVQRMIELWNYGKAREETTIRDLESLIAIGAFNELGGLHKSGTIEAKLIDHYVPFLPLEEKHVIECIKNAFRDFGENNPTSVMIEEALKHVTYGPSPHNLYSTAGCKRLQYKVSSIIDDKIDL